MPLVSHRLDLILVPRAPDRPVDGRAMDALLAGWVDLGALTPRHKAGARAGALVEGGFGAVRVDLPGRVTLYANQQGGFRVACPVDGGSIVPAFSAAVGAWRAGGERALACPTCGRTHALEGLDFRPPAAFATGALVFTDTVGLEPMPDARAAAEAVMGPVTVVLRRVSG